MKKTTINSQVPYVAIIITDNSKHILWVNDDFTEISGYTLDEIKGRKPDFLQGKKTKEETIQSIRKQLHLGKPFKNEVINYNKNGEEYTCNIVIHPIHDSNNKLTNFIAFEVDGDKTDSSKLSVMEPVAKYTTNSLKHPEEIDLYTKFITLVENQQLYLNPDLKLVEVAKALNSNTGYLSRVINHQGGKNFQNIINEYRVNAFKEIVFTKDLSTYTLFAIANECGFKNKSTFYRVFKQYTGESPKQFINQPPKGSRAIAS